MAGISEALPGFMLLVAPPAAFITLLIWRGKALGGDSQAARIGLWFTGYVCPVFYITLFGLVISPDYRYKFGHHYWSLIEAGNSAWVNLVLMGIAAAGCLRLYTQAGQQVLRWGEVVLQTFFTVYFLYIALMAGFLYHISWFIIHPLVYVAGHGFITVSLFSRDKASWQAYDSGALSYSLAGTGLAFAIKDYLAWKLYYTLPETPPRHCVIVTAASQGHPAVVGSWYDERYDRMLNRQLIFFYRFEDKLQENFPRLHRLLRRMYNRYAPAIAGRINTSWKADLAYVFLKPAEIFLRLISGIL